MTKTNLKKRVHQYIDQIDDDHTLRIVHAMLAEHVKAKNEEDDEIVGNIAGKPLTRGALKKRLKESERDYKEGRVYSHEEVVALFKKKFAKARNAKA